MEWFLKMLLTVAITASAFFVLYSLGFHSPDYFHGHIYNSEKCLAAIDRMYPCDDFLCASREDLEIFQNYCKFEEVNR